MQISSTIGLIVLGVLANASASLLLRAGATGQGDSRNSLSLFGLSFSWQTIGGIVLYFLAFLMYAKLVSVLPAIYIHPIITAASIICVNIGAVFFLGERLSKPGYLGVALLIIGVSLIALDRK